MLIRSGPGMHLYVIVTNRCRSGAHLLLSVSSVYENRHHDPACLIEAGEHEFINRQSYIVYSKPEQRPAGLITKLISSGAYERRDDVTHDLLARICVGVHASEFSRPWMIQYFEENTPI